MLGVHYLIDLWDCRELSADAWEQLLRQVIKLAGVRLIDIRIAEFEPQGMTVFCLLAESHLSVHTWPEKQYVGIDFFTCGHHDDMDLAIDKLHAELRPRRHSLTRVERGIPAKKG